MEQNNYVMPLCYPFLMTSSQDKEATPVIKQEEIPQEHPEQSFLLKRIRYLELSCGFLYQENLRLKNQVKEKGKVHIRIQVFQRSESNNIPQPQNIKIQVQQEKAPKKRRKVKELIKNFKCPYSGCKRDYASTLALNLHIRVKHGGGTKKQRKQLLKHIINAEINGKSLPEIKLNLPPNYVEEKKKLILQCDDFSVPQRCKIKSE